jgi:hypothetical protein
MVSPTVHTSEQLTAVMTHVVIGAVMGLCSIEKQQNRIPDCPDTLQTADRLVYKRRGSGSGGSEDASLWCVFLDGSRH